MDEDRIDQDAEDAIDIAEARAALEEAGESVPWSEVKADLGWDDDVVGRAGEESLRRLERQAKVRRRLLLEKFYEEELERVGRDAGRRAGVIAAAKNDGIDLGS